MAHVYTQGFLTGRDFLQMLCANRYLFAGLLVLAVRAQTPADTTTPRIAVNQEAKDAATQLSLLQQEVYMAQQQIMFLSLRGFEDHMTAKRVMFPSGKEIVPGYIFTPRQIDRNKRYPGLVIV